MAVDVYRMEIRTVAGVEPATNVLHFDNVIEGAQFPLEHAKDLIDIWVDELMDAYLACLSEDSKVTSIRCKRVNNGGGPTASRQFDTLVGTRPGMVGTGGVSAVGLVPVLKGATWRIAKIYFPALSKLDFEDDRVKAALVDAIGEFLTLLVGRQIGPLLNFAYVVWDSVAKESKATDLNQFNVSPTIGVQRRRRLASP